MTIDVARRVILLLVALAAASCGHIHPYPVTVAPPEYALVAAPDGLSDWDKGLAEQLTTTSMHCTRITYAAIREIEQRKDRVSTIKRWLAGIGSAAALGLATYTEIEDDPRKDVKLSLAALTSGTLLTTFSGFLSADERVEELTRKIAAIEDKQALVIEELRQFERQLLERALLMKLEDDPKKGYVKRTREVLPLEERFRQTLIDWGKECK